MKSVMILQKVPKNLETLRALEQCFDLLVKKRPGKKKVNDFFYRVRTPNGEWPYWYSWREVCIARRSNEIIIVTKMLKRQVPKHLRWG